MQNHYYIATQGAKDGPHDLVSLMRRIRAQKINRDTLIFAGDATSAVPASEIADLAMFFGHKSESKITDHHKTPLFTLSSVLHEGWRFTQEQNIMTVFAGGMALLCLLATAQLASGFGTYVGALLAWIIFVILHYFYSVFCLRLYRGQHLSADFMNNHLGPVISTLLLAAVCQAFMMAGGLTLLIIPAGIVAVWYIFVPFFIIDQRMSVVQAMIASRLLVNKFNRRYMAAITMLVLAYIGSLILIIPIPLTMPIFTAAMIKIYEELSAA